ILSLADVSRYRHFGHPRMRLPNEIEILWRIALPLLRHDLRVAFDKRVLRTVSATRREIPDHRLVHDDDVFRLCLDLSFRPLVGLLILTHMFILVFPKNFTLCVPLRNSKVM